LQIAKQRVEAALVEHAFEYKHFVNLLRKSRIELNVESLMHLAIWEPASFKVSASPISHTHEPLVAGSRNSHKANGH
jgi:ribosomal protein L20